MSSTLKCSGRLSVLFFDIEDRPDYAMVMPEVSVNVPNDVLSYQILKKKVWFKINLIRCQHLNFIAFRKDKDKKN